MDTDRDRSCQKNTDSMEEATRVIKHPVWFVLSCLLAGFAVTYKVSEAYPFWAYGEVSEDFIIARIYSLVGDYQFDMVIAAVLCGAAFYLITLKYQKYLKGYTLPAILSVITVFARSVNSFGDLTGIFETIPDLVRSTLVILGFTVIFRYVFALFDLGLDLVSTKNTIPRFMEKFFGEHSFRNVIVLLMILWLPVTIINAPGNYNADFAGQLMQTIGQMPWSTHHPLLLTTFIGGFFALFKAIFGNYDLGLFVWILLQEFAFASALSLTITYLRKKNASGLLLLTVLSVYAISPIYSNIATTAIKDVPFASACIWYAVLMSEYYEDREAFLCNRKNVFKICLAAFLVCALRNNGLMIVLVSGLVMTFYNTAEKKKNASPVRGKKDTFFKALMFLLIPILIFEVLLNIAKAATHAESDGLKEVLSVPMQQTGLYLTRYPDDITDSEKAALDALFTTYRKFEENYNPYIADPIKQYFDTDADPETVTGYFKAWFTMFLRHPLTYVESFFVNSYGWFDPGTDTSIRYEEDDDLFTKTGLFNGADKLLIFFYRYIDRISVLGFLQSPGLWTWIMFLLIKRRKGTWHLYPMQLITLLVCMAGPCCINHARYAFPIMFTIPFMLGIEGISSAKDSF